jgi:hypothetical protein
MSEPPTQPQQPPAVLPDASAACRACGAALAADQRYCLNCGERRGEPRVDFRKHGKGGEPAMPARANGAAPGGGSPSSTAQPASAGPSGGEGRQRDYAPLAAAGGIAVLGVMLLIGVLIGRGTGSGEGSSASPQVITVGAAEAGAEAGGATGEGGGGDENASASGKGKSRQGSKAVAGGSADTGDAPVASEGQLKELQEQSPEEYSESSAKLPDEIATPGAAPPTDDKAPGGGSGGTTIE